MVILNSSTNMATSPVYEKSNAIESVEYSRFNKSYATRVINTSGAKNRQRVGQSLIDYLCEKYKIQRIPLIVTERPRAQRVTSRGKATTYGFYKHVGSHGVSITIYNTTPSTHKEVGAKTFLNTLLHEFCHHYDIAYLKFDDSPHTAGFYKRISDLSAKLQ